MSVPETWVTVQPAVLQKTLLKRCFTFSSYIGVGRNNLAFLCMDLR